MVFLHILKRILFVGNDWLICEFAYDLHEGKGKIGNFYVHNLLIMMNHIKVSPSPYGDQILMK